ncbi:MAG: DMT family transporter [Terriglobia bacterium]
MRGLSLLLFCILSLIWGTTWLAIKVVVREMPALSAAAVRFLAATLLLAAYARLAGHRLGGLTPRERRVLTLLALIMIGIPYALVFYGEKFISSALTAILFASHPAFVLVLGTCYARRSLFTPTRLAGLLASFAGLWIIFAPRLAGPPAELRGMIAVLLAALVSASALLVAKYMLAGIDLVVATTWQFAGGGLFLTAAAWWVERPVLSSYSPAAWLGLAYLTVFGSCLGFVLYYRMLRDIAPLQASSLSFITPVVAVLAGWLILGEVLSPRTLVGAATVLAGLGLLHRPLPAPAPAGD